LSSADGSQNNSRLSHEQGASLHVKDRSFNMLKRITMGACAALLLAGIAFAQTAPGTNPPPPPPDQQMNSQQDGPDGQDGSMGGWFKHGRHHGYRHGGMGQMMGKGKGFNLVAGPSHALHVNCGDEPIKACIESAQPLIDAFTKANVNMPAPAGAPKTP
jgi:hypothetical protein